MTDKKYQPKTNVDEMTLQERVDAAAWAKNRAADLRGQAAAYERMAVAMLDNFPATEGAFLTSCGHNLVRISENEFDDIIQVDALEDFEAYGAGNV